MTHHTSSFSVRRRSAFTLIEMLVVIAIIGILAALILGISGIANSKMKQAKAQGKLSALITAIQAYKGKKGFYPPDNPRSTITNQLYYELTGTIMTNSGGTLAFKSPVNRDVLTTSQINALFGVSGFVNSSADPTEVINSAVGLVTSDQTANFSSGGVSFTMMGISVSGPTSIQMNSTDSKIINPWHYVSTNPTNNPGSFDLWIDVLYGGKTNRISNWSKDPQPL
jgi:prepilin-type N-terminal cleavage/methylation domain-containing protein